MTNKGKGYSLLEILIVIAIVSILSQISFSMFDMIELHKIHSVKKEISHFLYNSKFQAYIHKKTLVLCGLSLVEDVLCDDDFTLGIALVDKDKKRIISYVNYGSLYDVYFKGFKKEILIFKEGITSSNGRFYQCYKNKLIYQIIISRQLRVRIASQKENERDNNKYCG